MRAKDSGELFAVVVDGRIDVSGPQKTMPPTLVFSYKLEGTANCPYVGPYARFKTIHLAGIEEKTETLDMTNAPTNLSCLLAPPGMDIGIPQGGVPKAAMDTLLNKCQGFAVEGSEPDHWASWQRPTVECRASPASWQGHTVECLLGLFRPVSVLGFHFELDEMEVYSLA
mmetsp:Transcript_4652/g.12400  ORF Transcript_4652/g.12400 Transcript_4652/m.12400 type:complete len:170 (+) Transcript_4652:799-1308(+)